MKKIEFAQTLRSRLSGLPYAEAEDRISFYLEAIEDRMEEGLSEEAAVAAVGTVDEVAEEILREIPLSKIVKEKFNKKVKVGAGEIALIALGSPIWLSLLIAAFAVVFSLYAALWSVVISLWAADFALAVGGASAGLVIGAVYIAGGNFSAGFALIGFAFIAAGLAIAFFCLSRLATKGVIALTKKTVYAVKKCLIKKGDKDA